MKNLSIYRISDEYITHLHTIDTRVLYNKNSRRPYVGVVLCVSEHQYFVPMESPKPSHAKIKSGTHIFKINGGALGLLGFNNMIPVPDCALIKFDIGDEPDAKYRHLLRDQIIAINNNRTSILKKATKTYHEVTAVRSPFLCRISCDFKLLESASKVYQQSHNRP